MVNLNENLNKRVVEWRIKMILNYSVMKEEVFNQLGSHKIMVLATSSEDRVAARSMSCIIMGSKIYFQTDKRFLKTQQMLKNSNVALCVDNIQMEGIAKIIGHSDDNPEFCETYKRYFRTSYDAYTHLQNQVIIEVEPTFITLWKYADNKPYRDFMDCIQNTAYREMYDISK
jgi:general stress protein 26